jgi:hypothetical protein
VAYWMPRVRPGHCDLHSYLSVCSWYTSVRAHTRRIILPCLHSPLPLNCQSSQLGQLWLCP